MNKLLCLPIASKIPIGKAIEILEIVSISVNVTPPQFNDDTGSNPKPPPKSNRPVGIIIIQDKAIIFFGKFNLGENKVSPVNVESKAIQS